jgi:hypothetical protein
MVTSPGLIRQARRISRDRSGSPFSSPLAAPHLLFLLFACEHAAGLVVSQSFVISPALAGRVSW